MSGAEAVFTQALGLTPPWEVERVELKPEQSRIDMFIIYSSNVGQCPVCGAKDQPVHDHRARTWQHLHFFQFEAFVHCDAPRIACTNCSKTTQVGVPWARPGSHFTLMFEALALTLAREMPVAVCAKTLGCSQNALWRLIDAHTTRARARESHAGVRELGIDETACRRGHDYVTLVHDLAERRLLFATPGRGAQTLARAASDLRAHGGDPDAIELICMDMSGGFKKGAALYLPNAAIAFDRFHVIQLANAAVDEVRREEATYEPHLRRTRWIWLKDTRHWNQDQGAQARRLNAMRLQTARAWRVKEALRDIYRRRPATDQAASELSRWMSWARRCRLEPMKRLAATIKAHWAGVLHAFGAAHRHTGYVEAVNSLVQAAKARARGYATTSHFIAMCYLIAGKLRHLPSNPYTAALQHTG
ncbi:ISL3 family transposase [Castellaniella caeni]